MGLAAVRDKLAHWADWPAAALEPFFSSLVCCANSRGPHITFSASKALVRVHCPVSRLSPPGLDKPTHVPGALTDLSCYCQLPETGQRTMQDFGGGLTYFACAAFSDFPTVVFPIVRSALAYMSSFFCPWQAAIVPKILTFLLRRCDAWLSFFCIVFSGIVEAREPKQTSCV